MNAYVDYMTYARSLESRPAFGAPVMPRFRRVLRTLARAGRPRRTGRELDRLDDRLLKDVGLRRDFLPGGSLRITRI